MFILIISRQIVVLDSEYWGEKLEQRRNDKAGLATADYKHQRRLLKKFPGGSIIKVKPSCLELSRVREHIDYTS